MKKIPILHVLIAAALYLLMYVLGSSCGLIHPACYAYAGTFVPLLFAFVYLYTASKIQGFGAAVLLNGFALIAALIAGGTRHNQDGRELLGSFFYCWCRRDYIPDVPQ